MHSEVLGSIGIIGRYPIKVSEVLNGSCPVALLNDLLVFSEGIRWSYLGVSKRKVSKIAPISYFKGYNSNICFQENY